MTANTVTKPTGAAAWRKAGGEQGRGGRPWRRIRERVMQRDGGLCQPCMKRGRVTQGTEVDHVINRADGGTDDDDNLQTICADCHQQKTLAESLAARGLAAPRVSQACTVDGLPTDPRHPWAQGVGG